MAAARPAPTPRERLLAVLDELQEQELKRFKSKLNGGGLVEGCPGIHKSRLEKADALDVVELMINTYTSQTAMEVCHAALVAINQRELAAELKGY